MAELAMLMFNSDEEIKDLDGLKGHAAFVRKDNVFNHNGRWFLACKDAYIKNNGDKVIIIACAVMPTLAKALQPFKIKTIPENAVLTMAQYHIDRAYRDAPVADDPRYTERTRGDLAKTFLKIYKNCMQLHVLNRSFKE